MILIDNFAQVINQIEKERGIAKDVLIEAIKAALLAACKKKFGNIENLEATLDEETGEALIFASKEVVEKVEDEFAQIELNEAQQYQDDVEIGDVIMIEVTPDDFGRIAAQTAKQVILQRIREAEKDSVFEDFESKIGTIVTGTVQRKEGRNLLINLGRTEAVLQSREQIPGENYSQGDLIKVYVVSVEMTPKGPRVFISRAHVGFVRELFRLEIPEVHDGVISVINVSREVGSRAKVAVKSNDPEVGAVGTCVGHMGGRIQNIVKELNNERIDIIEYSDDPYEFLVNALKPAKINKIRLEESGEDGKNAIIYVNEDQLSLAIGRGGQNVRLASKLTGWKIEIEAEKSSFEANLRSAVEAGKKDEISADEVNTEEKSVQKTNVDNESANTDPSDENSGERKQEDIADEVNREAS